MKHKFTKENQPPREAKRVPKRKTLAKEALLKRYENIEDAKDDVLEIYATALKHGNKQEKLNAASELLRFLFPTKQSIKGELDLGIKQTTEIIVVPAFEMNEN